MDGLCCLSLHSVQAPRHTWCSGQLYLPLLCLRSNLVHLWCLQLGCLWPKHCSPAPLTAHFVAFCWSTAGLYSVKRGVPSTEPWGSGGSCLEQAEVRGVCYRLWHVTFSSQLPGPGCAKCWTENQHWWGLDFQGVWLEWRSVEATLCRCRLRWTRL